MRSRLPWAPRYFSQFAIFVALILCSNVDVGLLMSSPAFVVTNVGILESPSRWNLVKRDKLLGGRC